MLEEWPAAPLRPLPGQGGALVIFVSLKPSEARLRELSALLSADERAKAERYAFPELSARSAAARGQLREILGAALQRPPPSLRFAYGKSGKPALEGGELAFNVTHSGDLALVALAFSGEVGVDLELHKPRSYDDVARRFFARGEQQRLFDVPAAQRAPEFFRLWTAKEAFVKCTGDGITVPLEDFEARFTGGEQGHIEVLRGPALGRSFWLSSLPAGEGVSAAICGEGPPLQVQLARWWRRDSA